MIVSCKKRRVICRRYPYYRTSRILFDSSTANGEELSGLWNDCTHLEDLEAISCHRSFAAACVFQIELLAATRRDATRRASGALSTFRFHPGEPSNFISTFFSARGTFGWLDVGSRSNLTSKCSAKFHSHGNSNDSAATLPAMTSFLLLPRLSATSILCSRDGTMNLFLRFRNKSDRSVSRRRGTRIDS